MLNERCQPHHDDGFTSNPSQRRAMGPRGINRDKNHQSTDSVDNFVGTLMMKV